MALGTGEITVAVDVGGTQMRAALVRGDGEVIYRRALPTPHQESAPTELTALISSVARHGVSENQNAGRAVVGLPGQIDYRAGTLLWSPHLPASWPEQLSRDRLTEAIGLPVQIANDADLAAVGEAYFGSGREFRDVAYVTISTGIGAGFVFGGRLLRGDRSLGEIGHTVIDWTAWEHHLPATLEKLASGSGLTRMAVDAGLGTLTGKEINRLVGLGDKDALQLWGHAISAAAVGIANLCLAFAPEVVILGGGLGLQPNFLAAVSDTFTREFPEKMPPPPLLPAELGDNAGLVGAARWGAATN